MQQEELKLIQKSKSGDNNAFSTLIMNYSRALYRLAKTRLYYEDDILEAVQRTIVIAYEKINTLKKESSFKSWIFKILINNCNQIHNENNKLSFQFTEEDFYEKSDINSNIFFAELMNLLDTDERTICILYYQDQYTTQEISKILNINHNTIRTKLSRAKNKIKINLENNSKEVL